MKIHQLMKKELVKNWEKNKAYFSNFIDCDEYVKHTCSFWHYGVTDGKNSLKLIM